MKVERALECAVMAAEDGNPWAEALKALAGEVKRLRTPRPMSEAPRDGEFWGIVPLVYDQLISEEREEVCFLDRQRDLWGLDEDDMPQMFLGWLPTSSGGGDSNNES